MVERKIQTSSTRAAKPAGPRGYGEAPAVHGDELVNEVVKYRGNIPLKSFAGWVLLVLLGVLAVGLLTAQLLVSQRQNQLIEETAARVALQGQARARLLSQWVYGLTQLGDNLVNAQTVRLYVAEASGGAGQPQSELGQALAAQTPYMHQALADFVQANRLGGAHLLAPDGHSLLSQGNVPDSLLTNREAIARVARTGRGETLPLRLGRDAVVMDVLRPVLAVGGEMAGDVVDGPGTPAVGVLWFSLPVGDQVADLLSTTALDRPGERSALLQVNDQPQATGAGAAVVARTSLSPLGVAYEDFRQGLASGRALSLSAVDGKATFAMLTPVQGTQLAVLQEYRASDALALMDLYKPGLYTIVALGVVVLAAFMLAMTMHLMAQRNRTRVKLLGQTMEALVRAVEARDPYLAGHHTRVARLAVAVGNKLNVPVGERATLFYAAQLAAVGRLLVPRELLMKTGKLTTAERLRMENDIAKSQKVLEGLDFDLPIQPVIAQMYERVDGSGYPLALKDGQISRMAMILGAVDAYAAMTADRAYRKALTPAAAQKVMLESRRFDAGIIQALKGLK